jgi:RNA polymerase sigma-70 factor (ECF subfamily)
MGANGFDEFYAANFRRLTVQIYGYVGDLAEAQDVVQEAFCRAWPRWDKIAAYDDPSAWIRRVAWNIATSRWRRTRTAARALAGQRIDHEPELSGLRVDVVRALAQLPPNQRRVLVMHHMGDMPVELIARECDVPVGTVKSWLHRGRDAMAGILGVGGVGVSRDG